MALHLGIYSRNDQGLISYKGVDSSWESIEDLAQATHGAEWDVEPQEFGVLVGWPDKQVLWIGNLGVALANAKQSEWSFKDYTVGLECWVSDTRIHDHITSVKVEIEENALGCLRLTAVSGHNGGQLAKYGKALITPAQRENAPHKSADSTGYAIWALKALGLTPAALATSEDD